MLILETLFLIRYVDILKPKIDNLVTLCINEVDTDKIVLKHNIEAALERLAMLLERLIIESEFYTMGKSLEIKTTTSSKAIDNGFDYLIQNIFSKFGYLSKVYDNPIEEIKQTLLSDDIAQQQMQFEFENQEPQDLKEIKKYIDLRLLQNPPVILNELVQHFAKRPYGWGEFQTIVLAAKLFMSGAISLIMDSSKLLPKDAVTLLSKTHQWKKIKLIKRKIQSQADIKKAQSLGKELFSSIPPDGQDKLSRYIRDGLTEWGKTINEFKPLADTGRYPGKKEIDACLNTINKILAIHDSYELIKAFNAEKAYRVKQRV